jgi:hypothetical protein
VPTQDVLNCAQRHADTVRDLPQGELLIAQVTNGLVSDRPEPRIPIALIFEQGTHRPRTGNRVLHRLDGI